MLGKQLLINKRKLPFRTEIDKIWISWLSAEQSERCIKNLFPLLGLIPYAMITILMNCMVVGLHSHCIG